MKITLLCTQHLLQMMVKFGVLWWIHGTTCLHGKFRLDRFILSSCGGKIKTIFAVFWTWAFSGIANWQQSEKVELKCSTTNHPLATKSFLYANAFMAKSGSQTLDVQKA